MDKIAIGKALEILDLNLKEGKRAIPRDVQTSLLLSMDMMAFFILERAQYGYKRMGQLPHEAEFNHQGKALYPPSAHKTPHHNN